MNSGPPLRNSGFEWARPQGLQPWEGPRSPGRDPPAPHPFPAPGGWPAGVYELCESRSGPSCPLLFAGGPRATRGRPSTGKTALGPRSRPRPRPRPVLPVSRDLGTASCSLPCCLARIPLRMGARTGKATAQRLLENTDVLQTSGPQPSWHRGPVLL